MDPTSSTPTIAPMNPSHIGIGAGVGVAVVVIVVAVVVAITLVKCLERKRRGKEKYEVNHPPAMPLKPERVYEELPESVFICGTEAAPRESSTLSRQNGIQNDPAVSKVDQFPFYESDDHHSKSGAGSDLSGLSGVSGNIPGAHKMPTYSHDNSVVSDNLRVPSWEMARRYSDSSRQTQSTILPSSYHPENSYNRRSATEVGPNAVPFHCKPTSYGNMSYDAPDSSFPSHPSHFPQPPPQPPHADQVVLPVCGPSPLHSCSCASNVSHPSSVSSFRKRSDSKESRHSSGHSQTSQHLVSDDVLLTVMNCLMHNRDCEIFDCPCKQIQKRYQHLREFMVPTEQKKTPEHKHKKTGSLASYSSTESDSDYSTTTRRAKLKKLELNKLHPHYHISTRSHVRTTASGSIESHRRSRSLSDLTPITEIGEITSPQVGGPIKAGTPISSGRYLGDDPDNSCSYMGPTREELLSQRSVTPLPKACPPLLREISLSSDNLPVLCLNDCLLQLRTPSPCKPRRGFSKRVSNKPVLKAVREISNGTETDDSNTSSRSNSSTENEVARSSQSDYDEGIENPPAGHSKAYNFPAKRTESSGYESQSESCSAFMQAEGSRHDLAQDRTSPSAHRSCSPSTHRSCSPSSHRSCSPFETVSTVSNDGTVTKITEC